MSEDAPKLEEIPEAAAKAVRRYVIRHPKTAFGWFVAFLVSMVLLVAVVGLGGRYGVLTPQGRLFLEARTNGLNLGRIGKLRIEGLSGDIFSDFALRRLTISDEKGVWLEANGLAIDWKPSELFLRRLHLTKAAAGDVRLLRRPTLTPKKKDAGLPVSIAIDSLMTRLETLPEFSKERGLFDLNAKLHIERQGGADGDIKAASLLHSGDGMAATFEFGQGKVVKVVADAMESEGGALAGALGLSAKAPFMLNARIGGTMNLGTVQVTAKSGEATPLQATGGWNDKGGQGSGHIVLSASSLMEPIVSRFGPEAAVTVSAQRNGQGLYDSVLNLKSSNLTLSAAGPVKMLERSAPEGMALDFTIADLSKVISHPAMGVGTFKGRISGSPSDVSIKGAGQVSKFALAGYTLATVSGPLELRFAKKELTIKGDLGGRGGAGTGIFAAWMGAQPRLSATVAREPDGLFLIREANGVGSGMKLKAKGARTMFGGFSFDGDVQLSNLAAAYKGASGVVTGRVSARRSGVDKPWAFTADAKGADFATGYVELDRLMGKVPKVKAAIQRANGGAWTVTEAKVDGDAADADATGTFGPDNALMLAINWQAKGPFQAGPVEIAGNIKGDGKLTGTVSSPRVELVADIDSIDLPRLPIKPARLNLTFARSEEGVGTGAVKLTGGTAYGEARAAANFRFADGGVDLSAIDANAGGVTASGSLALRQRSPSRADLVIIAGKGAFLEQGQVTGRVNIADAPGGPTGTVKLNATGLRFGGTNGAVIRTLALSGDGPLSRMPYTLKAEAISRGAPITLEGSGTASENGDSYAISFAGGGKVRRTVIKTIDPMVINFGGPVLSAKGSLSAGGGRVDVDARQNGETVAVRATMAGVDLGVLQEDLAGKFDAVLTAEGRGSALTGDLNAAVIEARSRDAARDAAINGTFKAVLRGDRLNLDAVATSQKGLKSSASLILPAEASAAPFRVAINTRKAVQGSFNVDGELQPIWDLFFGGARSLGGRLVAQGTMGGTLADLQLAGQANLTDGRFEDVATGLKLKGVTIAASLNQDSVTVSQFTGSDGKVGTLSGQGKISLERAGASTFNLKASKFLLIANDMATAEATGNVTVTRSADGKATLAGKLSIDRADVVADPPTPSGVVPMDVVEINLPEDRRYKEEVAASRGPAVSLDVTLSAPRRIFIKGRGLDAELSIDAHVGGTTAAPALTGTARIVRGEYDFAGKRFEFDESGTVYLATTPDRIRLDLSATRDDPTLTAVVRIRGTAAKPEITLTSTPVLPPDEVLSQVLFGRSASQLSPLEAANVASALASLATGGGFDVIGGLRSFAGLDRLSFSGGDASGVAVSGGKYLTDDVYLELTGGGREGPSAQVEWRVSRALAIVSKLASTGDSRLSVRWRKETGKQTPAKK